MRILFKKILLIVLFTGSILTHDYLKAEFFDGEEASEKLGKNNSSKNRKKKSTRRSKKIDRRKAARKKARRHKIARKRRKIKQEKKRANQASSNQEVHENNEEEVGHQEDIPNLQQPEEINPYFEKIRKVYGVEVGNRSPIQFYNMSGYTFFQQGNSVFDHFGSMLLSNCVKKLYTESDIKTREDKAGLRFFDDNKDLQKASERCLAAYSYKIHLMPKYENLKSTIKRLIDLMGNKYLFKVNHEFAETGNQESFIRDNIIYPVIVIYPEPGKNNAQSLLNKIYAEFKNEEGLDFIPRFNKKINSLIYYAQGNGDEKTSDYSRYFEQPDMIHFSESFGDGDHALQDPA